MFETVVWNVVITRRLTETVRQWVPGHRTSHCEGPTAERAETVTRHYELTTTGGTQMLTTDDVRDGRTVVQYCIVCWYCSLTSIMLWLSCASEVFLTLAAPVLPSNSTGYTSALLHYAEYSCYVAAAVRSFVGQLHHTQDVLRRPSRTQHTLWGMTIDIPHGDCVKWYGV